MNPLVCFTLLIFGTGLPIEHEMVGNGKLRWAVLVKKEQALFFDGDHYKAFTVVDRGPEKPEPPAKKLEVDIEGYYHFKGKEVGGKSYAGVASIKKRGDAYVVQWMVEGGAPFSGVGIKTGMMFSVGWVVPSDKGFVRGINVYQIERDGRLVGQWTAGPGDGLLQSENMTRLRVDE